MASKGQIDYDEYPFNIVQQKKVNRLPDSPFISPEHLIGFQHYNCDQCILGVYYRLFVQAKEALTKGDNKKFKANFHRTVECFTDKWIISTICGYYPLIQSKCKGFSMSWFPVSDCGMKLHMQESEIPDMFK